MATIKYVSNGLKSNIQDIKLSVLYYDKVLIANNTLYEITPEDKSKKTFGKGDIGIVSRIIEFLTPEFINGIKIFIEENIVKILKEKNKLGDLFWKDIKNKTHQIISSNISTVFEEKDAKYDANGNKLSSLVKFPDEVKEIYTELKNKIQKGSRVDFKFLLQYYSALLSDLLGSISNEYNCITTSEVVNNFIKYYANSDENIKKRLSLYNDRNAKSALAYESIKLNLPNFSLLPSEEILEIREKTKAQLERFRFEIDKLEFELKNTYDNAELIEKAKDIVKYQINPSVDEISKKMKYLKFKIPKIILDEFKDPKSYAPLIGTFFKCIPVHLAAMFSLGLISANVIYDYLIQKKEINDSGLYYLLKMRNFN